MTQSKDKDEYTLDLTNIDGTTDTITITSLDTSDYTINLDDYMVDTIDISSISVGDVNLDWQHISNITFDRVMFEDDMPDPQELKEMCEEYPALEKVYENFKTVYKMVEQDWRGKQDSDEDTLF